MAKKKTVKRPATSKKKKTAARKKPTTKKKTVAKKKVAKKTAGKKAPVRKKSPQGGALKKKKKKAPASARKKTTSAKKPAVKKAPVKRDSAKPAASKKTGVVKKARVKKKTAAAKSAGSSAKRTSKVSKKREAAAPPRPALADAKAAAKRLAMAAGLRPVTPIAATVTEDAPEPKQLTKSPLAKRELEKYRKRLLLKRAEVLGDVSAMEAEALNPDGSGSLSSISQHMADQGSDEYDQSLSLGLAESQRRLLTEIDEALERMDAGRYGVCEVMGVAISPERLEATPWTKTCLEGARRQDEHVPLR